MMPVRRLVWRSWYYFRVGYGTYLAFLLGVFGNAIVIYRLALAQDPFLFSIFPRLSEFLVIAIPLGAILSISFGYAHTKKTDALRTDIKIGTEINPYNWIAAPGIQRELSIPASILGMKWQRMMMERLDLLTPEMDREMGQYIEMMERLARGERFRP